MRLLTRCFCVLGAVGCALAWLGFLAAMLGRALYDDARVIIDSAFVKRFGDW